MTHAEIRKLILKLSRRRHRNLRELTYCLRWPHTFKKEISQARSNISNLNIEINALLEKL